MKAWRRDIHKHPETAFEDFAYMLQEKPGCYTCPGNGEAGGPSGLHAA